MFSSWFGAVEGPEVKSGRLSRVVATSDSTAGRWTVELLAAAKLSSGGFYDLLSQPNNSWIYRNVEAETFREVLEDDGDRQTVEVEHESLWRFLFFEGRVKTRQIVRQDKAARSLVFRLAKEGLLKECNGAWNTWSHKETPASSILSTRMAEEYKGFISELHSKAENDGQHEWAVVHLTYSIIPNAPVPASLVKGIVVMSVENIWEDLRLAAEGHVKHPAPSGQTCKSAATADTKDELAAVLAQ